MMYESKWLFENLFVFLVNFLLYIRLKLCTNYETAQEYVCARHLSSLHLLFNDLDCTGLFSVIVSQVNYVVRWDFEQCAYFLIYFQILLRLDRPITPNSNIPQNISERKQNIICKNSNARKGIIWIAIQLRQEQLYLQFF